MRDALCLMLLGTTWLIASQILLLDPVSAWLLMQPSVLYPLFDRLFLSPSVPLGLFLSWDIPLVFSTICLTQSSWSLFFPVV